MLRIVLFILAAATTGGSLNNKGLVLVSSLDGHVTALDITSGIARWHVPLAHGPLISSSIDKIQMMDDQHGFVQCIPSLDGELYKWTGDRLIPFEINAEDIITSSQRLNDDSFATGTISYITSAIDPFSGNVKYNCTGDEGCILENDTGNCDLLIISRRQYRVRMFDEISGQERWNLSVGNVEIRFRQQSIEGGLIPHGFPSPPVSNQPDDDGKDLLPKIKFNMNEGLVFGFHEKQQVWRTKMNASIASVWTLYRMGLVKLDPFDAGSACELSKWTNTRLSSKLPSLFMGLYKNQWYVQRRSGHHKSPTPTRPSINNLMKWRPYVMSSYSRTPALVSWTVPADVINALVPVEEDQSYPYDPIHSGFYLTANEQSTSEDSLLNDISLSPYQFFLMYIPPELVEYRWYIAAFVVFCLMLNNFVIWVHRRKRKMRHSSSEVNEIMEPLTEVTLPRSLTASLPSRYEQDFTQIECIGRGGFGTVFKAQHRVDKRFYAVKRIKMPKKEDNKSKVFREVEALAKLEHNGIVRYFNTWIETSIQNKFLGMHRSEAIVDKALDSTCQSENSFSTKTTECSAFPPQSVPTSVGEGDVVFNRQTSLSDDGIVFRNTAAPSDSTVPQEESNKECNTSISIPISYIYIHMELCQTKTLKDWLFSNHKRERNTIFGYYYQMIDAVDFVHRNNFIHRDLKPSNVFFSLHDDECIKIGDFGLVTCSEESLEFEAHENTRQSHSTRTSQIGTQLYMSPEMLSNKSYNFNVDIYALGIIFFELLRPFSSEHQRTLEIKATREHKFPSDFSETFREETQIISRMLSQSPESRPPLSDIKEFFVEFAPCEARRKKTISQSSIE